MHPFLQQLLEGQAVEWKPLWEVTIWDKKFNAVDKSKQQKIIKYYYYLANDLKPLIVDGGDVKILTTSITDLWTTQELAGDNVSDGEVVAIPWGGNPVVQYYKGKFITADNRIATSKDINILDNKFLYYCLINKLDLIVSFYRGSGIKHPSMAHVLDLQIPIPPLSVQTKIVQILDTMTAITAELSMRNKQYQYYRDKLLSENELVKVGFEWKTLGEVGELIRGNGLTKKDLLDDGVPAIHYGQIYTHFGTFADKTKSFTSPEVAKKLRKAQYGDVLIAGTSENVQDVMKPVGWFGGEIVFSGDMFAFRPNNTIMTKYLTYMLQTTAFAKFKEKHAQGTKVIRIKTDSFLNYPIPIPPLSEQARIVAILDKFDTLTQSISDGLPREIELRQKQYAYYRERLLGFDGVR